MESQHQQHIDHELLDALAPAAERLTDRHLLTRKVWLPHEFVPWSLAEDYAPDYKWQPTDFPMPEDVRSALFVNLLTEDNLPFYVRDIDEFAGKDGIWRHWTGIWTFEEGRHSYAIRTLMEATRATDPVALEQAREVQVVGGEVPRIQSTMDGFVYVSLQELATRVSHFKTAQKLRETGETATSERHKIAAEMGYACLKRIAADENFHYLFYSDLVSEAIKLDPSKVVIAVQNQVEHFAMPGVGIPNFKEHSKRIGKAGIYNLAIHHKDILLPVIARQWKIDQLTGLTPQAAQAQEEVMQYIDRLGKVAARMTERQKQPVTV
jgi:acyl-[acyl-carrier-protein] desaturase